MTLRGYNATVLWLAFVAVTTGATCAVVFALGMFAQPELVIFALLAWAIANLVALWIFGGNQRKGVRLNNDAVVLITTGDTERARDKLRAAVAGVFPRDVVAMALFNLGIISIRERDLDSAKKLFRTSVDVSSGFRMVRASALYEGLSRAQLAFTQAVTGELDAAEATLAHGSATRPSPLGVAFAARARAAVALKRGRFEDVVTILDGERALLRNALSLQDAILSEAMRAYALSRLGDGYRAAARATAPIYADDLARAYVRSMLPETEPVLVS